VSPERLSRTLSVLPSASLSRPAQNFRADFAHGPKRPWRQFQKVSIPLQAQLTLGFFT
jgi:hypothetical protein